MKTYDDPQLRARLAADYVSGAMRGGARRRFEGLMAADASLRRQVRSWEDDLYALVWAMPAITPSDRVWRAIRGQIRQKAPDRMRNWGWHGAYLWRWCSATLAVALIAMAVIQPLWLNRTQPVQQVAVLQSEQGQAFLVIRADASGGMYATTLGNLTKMADGHALQLWSMPPGGKPVSLGLVAANGLTRLTLPRGAGSIRKLGISLEPEGGSPTGQPTGPVVMTGDVLLS
ncbi:anti-sigma factor domain-containing protein [Bordetella sp. FB-8]|uniref:anti-sigma factor n=1 Tax=Bordetella sp. FB-8 TaxID=1159870 RepID=UPI000382D9AA|nr:anti-sigma factor [Bordetella sp. FB-8]